MRRQAIMAAGLAALGGLAWRGAFDDEFFAERPAPIYATGGYITNYTEGGTNFTAHVFTNVGTTGLVVSGGSLNCEVLVVAGGGGGAKGSHGGGGGAGGLLWLGLVVSGTTEVVVGAGGIGENADNMPTFGSNSVFGTNIAVGGGYGGRPDGFNGCDGGSGGAGWTSFVLAGMGTSGQGHDGGMGFSGETYPCGGGGGAGTNGADGNLESGYGGNGGIGLDLSCYAGLGLGVPAGWFAGGGGGGVYYDSKVGSGGSGGGGGGGCETISAGNGVAGTGGGGGGQGRIGNGGNGGSGIVIVRYVQ